jgi:hypothetical protein
MTSSGIPLSGALIISCSAFAASFSRLSILLGEVSAKQKGAKSNANNVILHFISESPGAAS